MVEQVNGLYLGKTPARKGAVSFKMGEFVDLDSVKLPRYFGHEREGIEYGGLHNDEAGCCVIADIAHRIMIDARGCGRPVPTFENTVLPIYSVLTGYDPKQTDSNGNNPTDLGTDMATAAEFWRSTGIQDDAGIMHKAKSYGEIKVGDWDQLLKAAYLFGGASLGVQMPKSAMDDFDKNEPWKLKPGSQDILGGHAVTACGLNSEGHLVVITWGRTQAVTRPWLERFMDEGVCTFSLSYLSATGKSPELFDEAGLDKALDALTSGRGRVHHVT